MKGAVTKPDNRDIGLERLLLPNAFRSTVISMSPRVCTLVSATCVAISTIPAQVAKIPPGKVRIGS